MKDWTGQEFKHNQGREFDYKKMRFELRNMLQRNKFTHFITLASNHQLLKYQSMRSLLKRWDARVNREINGPKWAARPDERLIWFAFPEKMDVNPHWHLVVQVDPEIKMLRRAERTKQLPLIGEKHWLKLVPRGSFDCQSVESSEVNRYVTKMSADETHFNKFVMSREFIVI